MLLTCLSTVRSLITSCSAMRLKGRQREILAETGLIGADRFVPPVRAAVAAFESDAAATARSTWSRRRA